MALKALRFWHRPPPVLTLSDLVSYAETRSKFVSQTTLYSYVKTRAGTRYVSLMEDDVFANSVNIAKWEIYLACLCDMATYTAASVGRHKSIDPNVSRQHLRFIPRPGKWTIKNLAAVGTSVNGQRLDGEQAIEEGDKIKVGGFCFVTTKVGIPRPDKDETWELDDD